jgi:hypothetical protein
MIRYGKGGREERPRERRRRRDGGRGEERAEGRGRQRGGRVGNGGEMTKRCEVVREGVDGRHYIFLCFSHSPCIIASKYIISKKLY